MADRCGVCGGGPCGHPDIPEEGWRQTRWWRAIGPGDVVWAESSDEAEIRKRARSGDQVQVLMERVEQCWEDRENG